MDGRRTGAMRAVVRAAAVVRAVMRAALCTTIGKRDANASYSKYLPLLFSLSGSQVLVLHSNIGYISPSSPIFSVGRRGRSLELRHGRAVRRRIFEIIQCSEICTLRNENFHTEN